MIDIGVSQNDNKTIESIEECPELFMLPKSTRDKLIEGFNKIYPRVMINEKLENLITAATTFTYCAEDFIEEMEVYNKGFRPVKDFRINYLEFKVKGDYLYLPIWGDEDVIQVEVAKVINLLKRSDMIGECYDISEALEFLELFRLNGFSLTKDIRYDIAAFLQSHYYSENEMDYGLLNHYRDMVRDKLIAKKEEMEMLVRYMNSSASIRRHINNSMLKPLHELITENTNLNLIENKTELFSK